MNALKAMLFPLQLALSALGASTQRSALSEKKKNLLKFWNVVLGRVQNGKSIEGKVWQVVIMGGFAPGQDKMLKLRPPALKGSVKHKASRPLTGTCMQSGSGQFQLGTCDFLYVDENVGAEDAAPEQG